MELDKHIELIKSYLVVKSWLSNKLQTVIKNIIIGKARRALPIGTIRQRGNYYFKKTNPGVWSRITEEEAKDAEKEPKKELTKEQEEIEKIKDALKNIDNKVKEFDEQIKDKQSKGEDTRVLNETKKRFLKIKTQFENELAQREKIVEPKQEDKRKKMQKELKEYLEKNEKNIKDQSRLQELKNSIQDGNLMLKAGKSNNKKLTDDQKEMIERTIQNSIDKIKNLELIKQPEKRKRGRPRKQEFNFEEGIKSEKIKEKIQPIKNEKKISDVINKTTPETRIESQAQLMGYDPEQQSALEALEKQKYKYNVEFLTAEQAGIPDVKYLEYLKDKRIHDYTKVIAKNISLFNENTILEKEKPSYIPEMDERVFKYQGNRIPAVKLGENKYLIPLLDYDDVRTSKKGLAIVSLDILCAIQDYYVKKQKAEYNKRNNSESIRMKMEKYYKESINEKNSESGQEHIKRYGYHPNDRLINELESVLAIKNNKEFLKTIKKNRYLKRSIESPIKTIASNRATYDHLGLISDFVGSKNKWENFRQVMEDMKQKSSDMSMMFEEMDNVHAKGEETSYGKKGLKNTILNSHGVMVKRQNGAEITPEETQQIAKAIDSVYSVFGNRSSMAKNFNLRISHAGKKLMHARKFLGVYFPFYHTIGVSVSDEKETGFILAHEWAHFMDNYKGDKEGKHYYASDEYGNESHKIADLFRKNMKKAQKSDYQNRTCECFARAFEQYFMIKTGNEEEKEDNYVEINKFKSEIMPLIDKWLKDNEQVLKSMYINNNLRVIE